MLNLSSPIRTRPWFITFCAILLTLTVVQSSAVAAVQKIVIIPFTIHAKNATDLGYLRAGTRQMLATRLSWKDNVVVVDLSDDIRRMINSPGSGGPALANTVAKLTGADWVVTGSITEFAGSFSLDTAVLEASTGKVRTFYGQAASVDKIIPELNLLTAKINQGLFDRKTIDLPSDGKDTRPSAEPETDIRRANPETLLSQNYWVKKKSSRPFWKIWGKDDQEQEITGEGHSSKSKQPFWKIWGSDTDTSYDVEGSEQTQSKPFWKFWASDDDDSGNDADNGNQKSNRPFWKFWGDDSQDTVEEIPEPADGTKKPWWKVW